MVKQQRTQATTVLARAIRAENPGIVFASAASRNECDPLTDRDAKLFAGLIPLERNAFTRPPFGWHFVYLLCDYQGQNPARRHRGCHGGAAG